MGDVAGVLLEIVAGLTGYPVDMLDVGMDVEADLGIDSIKRVEILGQLQARFPQAQGFAPQDLASIRTLGDIVSRLAGGAAATQAPVTAAAPTAEATSVEVATPSTSTGLPMGLGRFEVVVRTLPKPYSVVGWPRPDHPATAVVLDLGDAARTSQVQEVLTGLGFDVRRAVVTDSPSEGDPTHLSSEEGLREWVTRAASQTGGLTAAVVVLGDPTVRGGSAEEDLAWSLVFASAASVALEEYRSGHGRSVFMSVAPGDGELGFTGALPLEAALVAGVAGMVKTLAVESPRVACKALTLTWDMSHEAACHALNLELLDPDTETIEVAYDACGIRKSMELHRSAPTGATEWSADELVLVTGGARGVTGACVRQLATRSSCGYLLMGRTPLQDVPEWAAHAHSPEELKEQAIAHLRASGERLTPANVNRLLAKVEAIREVHSTIKALQDRGRDVQYLAADVTDAAAVREALAPYAERIRGIVHGAGRLSDGPIATKQASTIRGVLDPKVGGLRSVLDAIDAERLRRVILFSSAAGLHGNPGQSDYAMANEAMSKFGAVVNGRGGHVVTSIAWGAWEGGMVTPELAAMFRERGVELLPEQAGAEAFCDEFLAEQSPCVVAIGPETGLSPRELSANEARVTVDCDLNELAHGRVGEAHRIEDKSVVPLAHVVGLAMRVTRQVTGGESAGVQNVRVFQGIELHDDPHLNTLSVSVDADADTAGVWLVSAADSTTLKPRYVMTCSAQASDRPARTAIALDEVAPFDGYGSGVLFHGQDLQGLTGRLPSEAGVLRMVGAVPDTSLRAHCDTSRYCPVAMDLLLQAALVWADVEGGQSTLPMKVDEIVMARRPEQGEQFLIEVKGSLHDHGASCNVEAWDAEGGLLLAARGVGLVRRPEPRQPDEESVA